MNRGRPKALDNRSIDNIKSKIKEAAEKENCVVDIEVEMKAEVIAARARKRLKPLSSSWEPSQTLSKRTKAVIKVEMSEYAPDETTESRDIANNSIRSMLSDYFLAEETNTVDPALSGGIDACTLKYAGKKFEEKKKAYAPIGTKHVKTVRKNNPDARRLRGDAKKAAVPNILPQRIKSVTFSTALGATAEIVLLKKLPKEAFIKDAPLFIKIPWLKKSVGPGGRPGYLVLMRQQRVGDRDYNQAHSNRAFCRWYRQTIIGPFIDAVRKELGKPNAWAMITFDGENGQIQEFRFNRDKRVKSGKGSAAATGARQENDRGKQFWNLHSYGRNKGKNHHYKGKYLTDSQEKHMNELMKGHVKMRSPQKKALFQFLAAAPYMYASAMRPSTISEGYRVCGKYPLNFEIMAETSATWRKSLPEVEKYRIRCLLPKLREIWRANYGFIPEKSFRLYNIIEDKDKLQRNELNIDRKRACMLPFLGENDGYVDVLEEDVSLEPEVKSDDSNFIELDLREGSDGNTATYDMRYLTSVLQIQQLTSSRM